MAPKVQVTSKPGSSKDKSSSGGDKKEKDKDSRASKTAKVTKVKSVVETTTTETTPVVTAAPVTPVAAPVAVTPVVTVAPVVDSVDTADATNNARREVTPESVDAEFTSILGSLQEEFNLSKDTGRPVSKFLRVLNKRLAVLQRDTRRIAKGKRKTGVVSENSGFMKKSAISADLSAFLGVAPDTRMSRVEVTSAIQEYITANNLKSKTNGRVVEPNKELTKLLGYRAKDHVDASLNAKGQAKNPDGSLYYWVIQKLIQKHFVSST
jgi:chromatin remodeling complex protein RSC6